MTNSTIFCLLMINHTQGLMSIKNKSNLPVSTTLVKMSMTSLRSNQGPYLLILTLNTKVNRLGVQCPKCRYMKKNFGDPGFQLGSSLLTSSLVCVIKAELERVRRIQVTYWGHGPGRGRVCRWGCWSPGSPPDTASHRSRSPRSCSPCILQLWI